jgi:CelD/BcsL family acetyltransferase involved in cellulose biosynthesis
VLREIPDDPALRSAWNVLAAKTDQPQVFYTWEWAKAVDAAYHEALRPYLVLAREANELVGLVALAIDSQNRAVFLTGTTGDYCDFLTEPNRRAEFVDGVVAELRRTGTRDLSLANLPADSPTVPALKAASTRHGFQMFARRAYDCARVTLGSSEKRSELKLALSKKKTFRRSMNALAREAPLEVSHLTKWAEVEPVLAEFANAHVARFLATNRISNIARSERRLFLSELARLLCESQNLALSRFMMGDHAIAWNYGFRFAGSWFWYQPTFESSLEVQSPGRLLLANILMEACDNPALQVFDLGLGAEGYKERVATDSRPTLQVTFSRSALSVAREKIRYHVAERIKQSPKMEESIRRTLSRGQAAYQLLRERGLARSASHAAKRMARSMVSREEIRFYQWDGTSAGESASPANFTLEPIDLHLLATALMGYEGDADTATYLLRSAQRAHAGDSSGYALLNHAGTPVHFCWVAPFEGFSMAELQTSLSAPSPDASLIYDCWTPPAVRNRGLYATAIAKLGQQVILSGRSPWIFSAASNWSSVRGIEQAGFHFRFAMTSRKNPLGRRIVITPAASQAPRS